jgi:hypothetical protein
MAVAMPVLLLFVALIIDAGNWFTHKSQLRNRADAAVRAAGVEYGLQWAKCTSDSEDDRDAASAAIVQAARNYAGTYNDQIGAQVGAGDVAVNDGTTDVCPPSGPLTSIDVKVSEPKVDSLFASLGLPIGQTSVSSRVELLKSASDTGFVPLAIENPRSIVKARVLFFNACTGSPLGQTADLTEPLPAEGEGMTLWGGALQLELPAASPATFASACPANFDYEPISMQIRLASRPEVDLGQECSVLIAKPFADCYSDVTEARAYACTPIVPICMGRDDAGAKKPGDQPLVFDVALGGPTCEPDPYYARLAPGPPSCSLGASVVMDWSDRPVDTSIPPDENFDAKLIVDGKPYQLQGAGPDLRTLTTIGPVPLATPGSAPVEIAWRWRSTVNAFNGATCSPDPLTNPCRQSGTVVVHRTNLADNPATDNSPTDVVRLARLSTALNADSASMLDSVPASGETVNVYAVIGLRSELKPDQEATVQTWFKGDRRVVCDPNPSSSDTETMVAEGCKPPFAPNPFTSGFWWNGTACPASSTWFSEPFGNTPWRCLRTAPQATSNDQELADGLAARIANCDDAPNRYLEYFDTMSSPIDPTDPRFVKVFVVPFGGFKGSAEGTVPVSDIASFYVTDWGSPDDDGDPCADRSVTPEPPLGRVVGYFVNTVGPNTGPVEPDTQPNSACDPQALRPCRAVLVR